MDNFTRISPSGHFPGQIFTDFYDATHGGFKSNPMLKGVDEEHIKSAAEELAELHAPSHYNVHNPIQILKGRVDTTDQSVLRVAEIFNFDADGQRRGRPLKRSIFYTDPYITCYSCNTVTFIDAMVRGTAWLCIQTYKPKNF
jgi:hypothetical protein